MDQLKSLIAGLNLSQRISIVVAVLVAAGVIFSVVHYRKEGDFRPLYSAMAPEDAAQVVQKLKETGVEYRLTENGGSVLVPSAKLAESRLTLASAGLPKSGRIGFELFDKTNFGATELVEHINYQRALEGELERSILSMAEVVQARVHLTFSKDSVFLDQQQPAKASVMVKLRPGFRISAQNVTAVTNLVASAVEGLSPESVAMVDMDGNLLSRPRRITGNDSAVTSESLEVRQQIEKDLVAKISATLDPLLGSSQFRVGASIDVDLTSGEQQEETFNPDQSVMASSQKSEDSADRSNMTLGAASPPSAGGIPGTASNLPHPPAQVGGSSGTSHRTENITYQTSRIVKHTRIPQGVIHRMSLSVLVGQPAHWEGSGRNRHRVFVAPSADTLKTIRDLVAGTTGFNMDRGDQLIVETLPFESSDSDPDQLLPASGAKPSAGPPWLEFVTKYQSVMMIAVGVLLALGVGLKFVFGMMKGPGRKGTAVNVVEELPESAYEPQSISPSPATMPAGTSLPPARGLLPGDAETAGRIRDLVGSEPAVAANVLRMWLQDHRA
ncbi:MAG TPA: flagellar basal-body MS-ring/collar protein FliF [Bryobacteraceae bacterium]|nr:flagellar basal-body MS-ring/collar protein FliF [Bryobacteraceae bacterium]